MSDIAIRVENPSKAAGHGSGPSTCNLQPATSSALGPWARRDVSFEDERGTEAARRELAQAGLLR